MAKLNAAARSAMPKSDFAGPGKSFPVSDPTHAKLAISGATRSENAGNISAGTADAIKSKARAKLSAFGGARMAQREGRGARKGHEDAEGEGPQDDDSDEPDLD